tara:strand:+ start:6355 stop:7266 length:912 start_codon:yes stop_codon:yes gene_type:complete
MLKKFYYIIPVLLVLLQACKDEPKIPKESAPSSKPVKKLNSERPDLNISLLLDLSDRISPDKYPDPAMEFYERDLGYINSVANAFEIHLRNKRTLKINDQIQLFIDPEPADKELNQKLDLLKLRFTKDNATKDKIISISEKYDSIPKLIYETAILDDAYVGSDIWRFFKSKVNDFCIEENHRNILIILTDGYIYHKNTILEEGNQTSYLTPQTVKKFNLNTGKWKERMLDKNYGFIPANKNLDKLEVLVLGINPDIKNPYEEDVIQKYWKDWLEAMGVSNYEIKNAGLPSNMQKIVDDFILQE